MSPWKGGAGKTEKMYEAIKREELRKGKSASAAKAKAARISQAKTGKALKKKGQ